MSVGTLAGPSGCNPPASALQVQLLPGTLVCPIRLEAKAATFSGLIHRFESGMGYFGRRGWFALAFHKGDGGVQIPGLLLPQDKL